MAVMDFRPFCSSLEWLLKELRRFAKFHASYFSFWHCSFIHSLSTVCQILLGFRRQKWNLTKFNQPTLITLFLWSPLRISIYTFPRGMGKKIVFDIMNNIMTNLGEHMHFIYWEISVIYWYGKEDKWILLVK